MKAFVEAAACGSFSAAARRLGKSQSTVSIAIANLETDIGCALFDRSGRQPQLNDAGRQVLVQVEAILTASQQLDALAERLAARIEPLLSVVMTDIYSVVFHGEVMARFAEHFPHTELRCGPAEDADVVDMIQKGQVHMGILAAQPQYPADVATARLPDKAGFRLYVHRDHPLAALPHPRQSDLDNERQLMIRTYAPGRQRSKGQAWSAPDYLTLMEFAERGFGWAELPTAMVQRFGQHLVELPVAGYPRAVEIDVAWSRRTPLGPAGQWLLEQLQIRREPA
ncbi:LysR family transcriptional regulator [Thalassolituus sp. LLYu03]|uniref:LysR family transcriptional regulator n=1 Tax=Thalassolituus sp. LLYu03 TaxID=3421656 RepID=UPI003D2E2DD8